MLKIDLLIHKVIEAVARVEPIPGLPGIVEYLERGAEQSGITIDITTHEEPTSGYVIGLAPYSVEVPIQVIGHAVRQFIRQNEPLLRKYWLGAWEDSERVHLDIVTIKNDFQEALALARENNQIAFYHIDTDTTHYVDDYSA